MSGITAEIAVIGGGAAGLSAALTLARARRSVVVIDSSEPRNAPAVAARGLLGNEGIRPLDLLAKGRQEAESFGAVIRPGRVASVVPDGLGFRISLGREEVISTRAVIVATGVRDLLPQIEGITARWGRDVVHCPYCHGWEIRGQRIGLVATNPMSALQALMFQQWSDRVQFFSQGLAFSDADLEKLAAVGIPVTIQNVRQVVVEADRLVGVILKDGSEVDLDVLAVPTRTIARLNGLGDLGLETTESPMGVSLVADAAGHTSVPGVWAAGNVVNAGQQVSEAAANGARVAMTLNTELVFQDADAAVVSTRAFHEEKTA